MRFRISPLDQASGPRRAATLGAAVVACLALPAMAGEPPASAAQAPAATTETPSAGMRVAVDPATGQIRPMTADEAKALDALSMASARRSTAPALRSLKGKDGAVGVELDPSYMVYTVATVGHDGKLRMDCVNGANQADEAVHKHVDGDKTMGGADDGTK